MKKQCPSLASVLICLWLLGVFYAYVSYLAADYVFIQKALTPAVKIGLRFTAHDTH